MKIAGYILFLFAFGSYARLILTIRQLVTESRQLRTETRFNWFWWIPALKVHRVAYPTSPVRRRIVTGFLLTFVLMAAGLACIGVEVMRTGGVRP
ncbi:hypothetical protein [Edaphobacter modestus]|uniref:Uncharacterized protein n=1 Tax=Edaphobacter modestus TaxID=388466 RepID=A0A4Q7YGX0_9BACT|nr:hypothetical protein [Edaphobacter modestus]RZU35635.1 hypothetical protein BDD14_5719 [Edaphobacter modestus]